MHYIPEVKRIAQEDTPAQAEGDKELKSLEDRLAAAGAK